MNTNTVKVLVVDDSSLFRQMLIQNLSAHPQIEIIGYAINAYDAKKKIPILKPDVLTLDVEMPGMSGIDFLKQLLPENPLPVILVSSLNLSVFDALSAGAVDFVRKPDMSSPYSKENFFSSLTTKILGARSAKIRLPKAASPTSAPSAPSFGTAKLSSNVLNSTLVAIGASTGGTEATLEVLKRLPAQVPGIVITQHMPEGFTAMYAQRLNRICKMEVKEAQNGDLIRPGLALIAPGGYQMEVIRTTRGYCAQCRPGAKVSGHCPSVDVLFSSIAKNVTERTVGIIMTGMGQDGAHGLLEMRKKGAYTIGQDKNSCVVYGMPMVAYNIGAVAIQSSCDNIAAVLMNHLQKC